MNADWEVLHEVHNSIHIPAPAGHPPFNINWSFPYFLDWHTIYHDARSDFLRRAAGSPAAFPVPYFNPLDPAGRAAYEALANSRGCNRSAFAELGFFSPCERIRFEHATHGRLYACTDLESKLKGGRMYCLS